MFGFGDFDDFDMYESLKKILEANSKKGKIDFKSFEKCLFKDETVLALSKDEPKEMKAALVHVTFNTLIFGQKLNAAVKIKDVSNMLDALGKDSKAPKQVVFHKLVQKLDATLQSKIIAKSDELQKEGRASLNNEMRFMVLADPDINTAKVPLPVIGAYCREIEQRSMNAGAKHSYMSTEQFLEHIAYSD